MQKMVFINLPVADLDRSIAFYEAIGATRNPQFSDHTAACMALSDTISVMILTHAKFAEFTPRPIADARAATEVLIALNAENREEVDHLVSRAAATGGKADPRPAQDLGFMYSRAFEDPDGHIWEPFFMDMAAIPQAAEHAS